MFYRLFGFWVRREACRLAATARQRQEEEVFLTPRLWAMTVFFEKYLIEGAEGTMEDFGPKEPVKLKAANE